MFFSVCFVRIIASVYIGSQDLMELTKIQHISNNFTVIIVDHVFPFLLSSTAKRVGGILLFVFVSLKTDKGGEYFANIELIL